MDSFQSSSTMLKSMCDKVDILKTNLELLKCIVCDKSESLKIINQIVADNVSMVNDLEELKNLLNEQKSLYEKMKVEEVEISHFLYKIDQLDKDISLQQTLEKSCTNVNENVSIGEMNCKKEIAEPNGNIIYANLEPPFTLTTPKGSNAYEFSPLQLNTVPPHICKSLTPKCITFDIAYLSMEEFLMVPKYMVGRLTVEVINKFIDTINDALSKKCSILSKRTSELKTAELILYRKYKRLQVPQHQKGLQFVTEEDIAREYNKSVLEKKCYNYLTILRHTKRLFRDLVDGTVVYMVTSPQ